MSAEYQMTIKPMLDESWIADEAVSLKKVDKTISDAVADAQKAIPRLDKIDTNIVELQKTDSSITSTVQSYKTDTDGKISGLSSRITQNADSITSVVTNLGDSAKAQKAYSAIAQLQDGINLRVKSSDFNGQNIVSQINVSPSGTLIDGKYLHVTGTTKFDDNVIVGKMIAANSITADEMNVSSLSAISAILGTVTGGVIKGSVFQNDDKSFYVDNSGNIVGANITGSSLNLTTNDLKVAGFKIRAIDFIKGSISSGEAIPLPSGYTASECIWWVVPNGDYIFSIDNDTRAVTFRHLDSKGVYVDNNLAPFHYETYFWSTGGSGTYYCLGVKAN